MDLTKILNVLTLVRTVSRVLYKILGGKKQPKVPKETQDEA